MMCPTSENKSDVSEVVPGAFVVLCSSLITSEEGLISMMYHVTDFPSGTTRGQL